MIPKALCNDNKKRTIMTDLLARSKEFERSSRTDFPTSNNRLQSLLNRRVLTVEDISFQANSVRISTSQRVVAAAELFLDFKRRVGTPKSVAFYRTIRTVNEFFVRCIAKRPIVFFGRNDRAVLRNGMGVSGGFSSIGTENEEAPLLLEDYLSYDEMLLSALLIVSSFVTFINDGDRNNMAKLEPNSAAYQQTGVMIGAVGPRFEREDEMESIFILLDKNRSTTANGYGASGDKTGRFYELLKVFAPLYSLESFPTWQEALGDSSGRFKLLKSGKLLDKVAYASRISVTIESMLLEANERGAETRKQVFMRLNGLGLGVWAVDKALQQPIFVEQIAQAIARLDLPYIDVVQCCYMAETELVRHASVVNDRRGHSLRIEFSQSQNHASPLANPSHLLVSNFAWDC